VRQHALLNLHICFSFLLSRLAGFIHVSDLPFSLTLRVLFKAALVQVDGPVELQRGTNMSAHEHAVADESTGSLTLIEDLHPQAACRAQQLEGRSGATKARSSSKSARYSETQGMLECRKYSASIGEFCDLCLAHHTMRAEHSRVLPLLWLNPRPVHLM
jgi:hypothetical protein